MSEYSVRMARAREAELDALLGFGEELEEHIDSGSDEYDLGEWFIDYVQKHNGLPFSISRIVWGYRTMFENACDPDASALKWKPEIARVLTDLPSEDSDG